MADVRILIAESDEKYIMALERCFIDGFERNCQLSAVTDKAYLDELFRSPQSYDIMIVNEEMFSGEQLKHEIANMIILAEQADNISATSEMNVTKVYKYSSPKEIYNEIVSNITLGSSTSAIRKGSELICVYSPSGGSGKTTFSFGLCAALADRHKRVLYISADRLQSFASFMLNPEFMQNGSEKPLKSKSEYITEVAESVIKEEKFSIFPPFSRSLTAMGISCDEYIYLAEKMRETKKFDFIVFDLDSAFDESVSKAMSISDRSIILAEHSKTGIYKMDRLMETMDCSDDSKFTVICSKFREGSQLENVRQCSMNIPFREDADVMTYEDWAALPEFEKLALKLI